MLADDGKVRRSRGCKLIPSMSGRRSLPTETGKPDLVCSLKLQTDAEK